MLFHKQIILSDTEKCLVFADKQFSRILTTGKHKLFDPSDKYSFRSFDLSQANYLERDAQIIALVDKYPDQFAEHLQVLNTSQNEFILVWRDSRLVDILPPSSEAFVWITNQKLKLEKIDIVGDQLVEGELQKIFRSQKEARLISLCDSLTFSKKVPDNHVGFLIKDEQFVELLPAGHYMWWVTDSPLRVMIVNMRLQNLDVSGQEILTKDRVSIRLNLLANWQIADPEKLILSVEDHDGFLYRELQLALRAVVATKTLDELLADKNLLNEEIQVLVEKAVSVYGIELKTVGVKDVILPGEMKAILSQVVEAQKAAEANVIRRREETQATRSLHNTAKVMENNPVLLRLKELETLEKITDKISTLNVYGGLNGVMNDLVTIADKTTHRSD